MNRRVYHAPGIDRWYRDEGLDRAETMALLTYQPAFAARDVLDLGIGAGRTTRVLASLARRYVGTDYSPPMIAYVHATLRDIDARLCDMRDLSQFDDASFDFVMASCNLLDAVSHDDRLRVLAEVRRVLRAGGTFVFSSHNRRFKFAARGPYLVRAGNPATQAAYVLRFAHGLINHARVSRYRRDEAEYALLNDLGHDYAALHYYIDRATQQRQLERAGFVLRDVFDSSGRRVAGTNADENLSDSPSLLYVATTVAGDALGAASPNDPSPLP